ncbi:MAG: Sulfur carrier protein FdhD [Ktedonobacterales bacterium]|jgi:FdhD protein|nr:MAG: Sulfur carrier protein FdhD [Ktedonobacterales bacterium]
MFPQTSATRSQLDPLHQVSAPVERWHNGERSATRDELAVEEPLELRTRSTSAQGAASLETLAVILRTPGHDQELAAGFLYSEGLLASHDELAELRPGVDADGLPSDNLLDVLPGSGVNLIQRIQESGYTRRFAVNASCGICGKNTVEAACAVLPPVHGDAVVVAPETLYSLPEQLRAQQRVFAATGGLHAAGLFDTAGHLLGLREDIGRHNAVDKLVGRALLDGALPLADRLLLVSGRLSFEIVLKAWTAGIPLVAAVSAPSSLAVDLAMAGGITLVGFLRGENANVYTHPERVRR